ncbi:MAG: Fe-S cluster assembly protein SufD, partial [Flavobacteriales bacterium]
MTTIIANNKVSEFVSSIANENLPCWEKFSGSRKKAKEILTQLDFPTTRNEYWKYSRVTKIARETYHFKNLSEEKIDLDEVRIPNLETYEIVFINGFISLVNSNLPSSDELEIIAFSDSKSHDYDSCFSKNLDSITNIFSALNTAYFTDGVLIKA